MKPVFESPDATFHESPFEQVNDFAQAHLWFCDLDANEWPALAPSSLAREEHERASRLKTSQLQRRFIASRVFVRAVLGNVLGMNAGEISFATTPAGKPILDHHRAIARQPGERLCFNFSHSENVLLLGIAFGREIGVDVEVVKPELDVLALAQTQFSERECVQLRELSGRDRVRKFYQLWTRFEASAKATGEGIAAPRQAHENLAVHQFDFDADGRSVACAVALQSRTAKC